MQRESLARDYLPSADGDLASHRTCSINTISCNASKASYGLPWFSGIYYVVIGYIPQHGVLAWRYTIECGSVVVVFIGGACVRKQRADYMTCREQTSLSAVFQPAPCRPFQACLWQKLCTAATGSQDDLRAESTKSTTKVIPCPR
jgi:hypothetical protein